MQQHEQEKLRAFVARIEEIDEQRRELQTQKSEVMREAVDDGFNRNALREVLRKRKMKAEDRETQEDLVDQYMLALGMPDDTPIERAARGEDGEDDKPIPIGRARGRRREATLQ